MIFASEQESQVIRLQVHSLRHFLNTLWIESRIQNEQT